jgi:hypothetical protein
MISGVMRARDRLMGIGEAAVTVPPLDGALRPNRFLDEAPRFPLNAVGGLATVAGRLYASAENTVHVLEDGRPVRVHRSYPAPVACIASAGDALAVALATGEIVIDSGPHAGRSYRTGARCITAMAVEGDALYLADGSARNPADDWQLDLLQRSASGCIWRLDLAGGEATRIATGLAYPAGVAVEADTLVYAEAWRHRLVRMSTSGGGRPEVLYADLPGYPGRIAAAKDGFWLAVFAPRTQLVEFVLREPTYCARMVAEVPRPYWIAPKLRAGRSFYEPLQGGGVKHLGLLKPWAPTLSAGLVVRLDRAFQPRFSLHSRADGATHGVISVVEHDGRVVAAARGDGVVVSLPVATLGGEA